MSVWSGGIPLLIGSLIALLLGPILYRLIYSSRLIVSGLDAFVFVGIGGLIIVHVIPELIERQGWIALPIAFIGLFGPLLFEHFVHHLARQAHLVALFLACVGLLIHAFADGIILNTASLGGAPTLPVAVLLHRLPEGLTVWWLLRPAYGVRLAVMALAGIAMATLLGFVLSQSAAVGQAVKAMGLFQALMAGALLHVVFHRPHPMAHHHGHKTWRVGPMVGMLFALLLLSVLAHHHVDVAETATAMAFFNRLFDLALESAPALAVAYLVAGLAHAFMPASSLRWLSRGTPLSQALRGAAFGLPLPLCSCGVLPVYRTLVLQGVPLAAALSFLVATPELGLDAILLSIPLLGGPLTAVRLVGAVSVAVAVGWAIGRWAKSPSPVKMTKVDCCRGGTTGIDCDSQIPLNPPLEKGARGILNSHSPLKQRLQAGLHAGLVEMVDHTGPWILLGLIIAALIDPQLPIAWLEQISDGLDVPLFALLGIPAYVCASGATPLIAALILHGLSPGAAIAFLLTGPATNATTFGILSQLHGRKLAAFFGAGMLLLSVGFGYLTNALLSLMPAIAPPSTVVPFVSSSINRFCLFFVALLYLISLLRQGPRAFIGQILPSAAHGEE